MKISGSPLGVICSEETRAKISASNLGQTRSGVTRAKMAVSQIGNTNGQNHPNSIKIRVTDLELKTKTIYKSMRAAARALNIQQYSISKYFLQNMGWLRSAKICQRKIHILKNPWLSLI